MKNFLQIIADSVQKAVNFDFTDGPSSVWHSIADLHSQPEQVPNIWLEASVSLSLGFSRQ